MNRGTTPKHTFTVPFTLEAVDKVRVTYAQGGKVILTKETGACAIENNSVSVSLSQEETLLFDCKKSVEIQLRLLMTDGTAQASDVIKVGVGECLDGEVLE